MRTIGRLMRSLVGLPSSRRPAGRPGPAVESLEDRVLLYSATGNAWPSPQLITLSIVPDGTDLGGVASNLNATFNANPRLAGKWLAQLEKAAQVWAQQTNVNFALVSDNGTVLGGGSYQQGDPAMGDIRIGGFNFGTSSLAFADMPAPANNYSVAGDVMFNTGLGWGINNNSFYDLFTVATHEIGHALGLGHSAVSASEMYATYNAIKPSLNADDIAGIRSIYSAGAARTADAYNTGGASNGSFATAANLTSSVNAGTLTAAIQPLDITTAGQSEYFSVTAPAGSTGVMTVVMQSAGLSLLSPKMTIYAADKTTVLGSASGLNQYGATLTVSVAGVTAGTTYYLKAQGADTTAFGTGRYALTLNFGGNSNPTVALPSTTLANGNPINAGGGLNLSVDTPGREVMAGNPSALHKHAARHAGAAVHHASPFHGALRPWSAAARRHVASSAAVLGHKHG